MSDSNQESKNQAEAQSNVENELPKPTSADIELATKLKEEGNKLIQESKHDEAIEKYSEAIKLNRDPAYFCNRAAALCHLEKYDLAIDDCRTALSLNPNYSKAYGRMGVALLHQNRYAEAVEAYKRAVELDPQSEMYKTNLAVVEKKLRDFSENPLGRLGELPFDPNMFAGLGENFASEMQNFMNSPQVQQMTSQFMNDPNIMAMMGEAFASVGENPADLQNIGEMNLENVMQIGSQFAETFGQQNPELFQQVFQGFETIRQQAPELQELLRHQFPNMQNPGNEQNPDNEQNEDSNDGKQPPSSSK